jgi:hypothetical protein
MQNLTVSLWTRKRCAFCRDRIAHRKMQKFLRREAMERELATARAGTDGAPEFATPLVGAADA